MPIWKFKTLEDAAHHLNHRPNTPEASVGTALFLLSLSEASRRGIRTVPRGIHRYRTVEEAEAARERFALDRLRAQ